MTHYRRHDTQWSLLDKHDMIKSMARSPNASVQVSAVLSPYVPLCLKVSVFISHVTYCIRISHVQVICNILHIAFMKFWKNQCPSIFPLCKPYRAGGWEVLPNRQAPALITSRCSLGIWYRNRDLIQERFDIGCFWEVLPDRHATALITSRCSLSSARNCHLANTRAFLKAALTALGLPSE